MGKSRGCNLGRVWLCALGLLWASCGGSDANGPSDAGLDGGDAGETGAAISATCAWAPGARALALPSAEVKGVLRGQSRNASTTCTRHSGTGGPEAIYVFTLAERRVVEIEVHSEFDTVLAVRRACDDPLSEVACSAGIASPNADAGGFVDAASDFGADAGLPTGGEDRGARVRTALDPGTYFVVIDEAAPFGVGGDFTLKLFTSAPPVQSSCQAALPVMDGASLGSEDLSVAVTPPPACSGASPNAALYYRATIPSGQRLTVRATPTGGDRPWAPTITLVSACDAGTCLGSDRPGSHDERVLRYVNNGPTALPVIFAVGASTAKVDSATFRLDVSISDPVLNGTCQSARPLTDGLVLRNQDLAEGQLAPDAFCSSGGQSLFYSVTLLPQQSVTATIKSLMPGMPFSAVIRDSCSGQKLCQPSQFETLHHVNNEPVAKTLIIQVTAFFGVAPSVFDMIVSLPPPPGGIQIDGTPPLATSENGQAASFTVRLTSPPTATVTVPITSSDPKEGTPTPASLAFDHNNWAQAQKVTVTGVDDTAKDGDRDYHIVVGPASSADGRYAQLRGGEIAAINRDDEPGFRAIAGRLVTSESGAKATFQVVLTRPPIATVQLPIESSEPTEAKVSPATLVFGPSGWDTPQTVTLTGVDDDKHDGTRLYKVLLRAAISTDAAYAGVDPADLDARNVDNDLEPVAAHSINDNIACHLANRPAIGADEVGNIYVAMACDRSVGVGGFDGGVAQPSFDAGHGAPPPFDAGALPPLNPDVAPGPQLAVAVSQDGGRTFSPPLLSGFPGLDVRVAGAGGSSAYLAGATFLGLTVMRTENGGSTWQTAAHLSQTAANDVHMAAAGQTVAVASHTGLALSVWTSTDGARTFQRADFPTSPAVWAIHVDGNGVVRLALQSDAIRVVSSSDGGKTFTVSPTVAGSFGPQVVAFGPKSFYAANDQPQVFIAPLSELGKPTLVGGLPTTLSTRLLLADAWDGLAVVEQDGLNSIAARWLPAGGTAFSAPKTFGFNEGLYPAGVALTDRAVAVSFFRAGRVFVAVETRP